MGGKKTKKENGSGSIYFVQSTGKWKADIVWTDPQGNRQRKTFSSAKKTVVKAKLEDFKKQLLLNSGNISKGSVTFEEFANNWLSSKLKNSLKPSSYMRKEVTL